MVVARSIPLLFSAGLMMLAALPATAQNYPSRAIRVVTSPTGTGIDFQARLIAQGIAGPLGQQVVIENRPSGVIPGEVVAKAAPDGYTLLYATNVFTIGPLLSKTPYDPVKDFVAISLTAKAPNLLVITASLPVKSVKELIALAKAHPGELNYSAVGTGGLAHLAVEYLKSATRTNMLRVPYSTTAAESNDLVAGRVQLTITSVPSVSAQMKSGKLRALAVTSAQPFPLFPELPTLAATVPGYEAVNIYGMYAPINTPAAIVNRVSQEIARYLHTPEAKEKMLNAGVDVIASTPEEHAAALKADIERWAKVIKDAGIKGEDK